jgi:hypothetical protein
MAGAGKITIAEVEELLQVPWTLTKFIFQESWCNASSRRKV